MNNTRVIVNPLYKSTRKNNTRRNVTRRNNRPANANTVVVRNPAGLALFAQGWRNKQDRLKTLRRSNKRRFNRVNNTNSNKNNNNLSNRNVSSIRNLTKVY
jgi:hypothetical protein